MPSPVPPYLASTESYATILTRLLAYLATYDVADGSTFRMLEAPIALELDRWRAKAIQYVTDLFLDTASTNGLDAWGRTLSTPRKAATSAVVSLTLGGTNGTVVPAGTQLATTGTTSAIAVVFTTTADSPAIASGVATVAATCNLPGSAGNVLASTIVQIVTPRTGLTSVTNPAAATAGTDTETDDPYRARLRLKFQPSRGGNLIDYESWALAQPGVGAVSIVGQRDFLTNVSIAIAGVAPTYATVPQAIIDAVQNAIQNPYRLGPYEAENTTGATGFARTGAGLSQVADALASSGQTIQMAANAAAGQLQNAALQLLLPEAGIYQAMFTARIVGTPGTGPAATFAIYDTSQVAYAKTSPADVAYGGAILSRTSAQLSGTYAEYLVRFYWNGTDTLALQATRPANTGGNDATISLLVDSVRIVSLQGDGFGLAPVCHNVVVQAGTDVPIDISATLTVNPPPGQTALTVRANAAAALSAYLNALVFLPANDVLYAQVGNTLLAVPGVTDYATLQIRKSGGSFGVLSIPIAVQEIARTGTFTLT